MATFEEIELEYRILSAKLSYAAFSDEPTDPAEHSRLAELSRLLVEMSAPDFTSAETLAAA